MLDVHSPQSSGNVEVDLPEFSAERLGHFPDLSLEVDGALEAERQLPPWGYGTRRSIYRRRFRPGGGIAMQPARSILT